MVGRVEQLRGKAQAHLLGLIRALPPHKDPLLYVRVLVENIELVALRLKHEL